jgi:gamma-glutamyltranspeptidase / glutathione hydrolase
MAKLTALLFALPLSLVDPSSAFAAAQADALVVQSNGVQASLVDELELIYPDSPVYTGASTFHSDGYLGGPTAVHGLIEVADPQIQSVHLEFRLLDEDGASATLPLRSYQLLHVPVEENTGFTGRTEQFKSKVNPFVVRRAPFRVYEVMRPLASANGGVELPLENGRGAFRLELDAQREHVGLHRVAITVTTSSPDQVATQLQWDLRIFKIRVAPPSAKTLHYTNWFSPNEIAKRHRVELWSEDFWPLLKAYARLMVRGRQNTFWVRLTDFFEVGPTTGPGTIVTGPGSSPSIHFHRQRFERYIRVFDDVGMHWMEGAPIARRPNGDWSSDWLQFSLTKEAATSEQGQASMKRMFDQLQEVLHQNQWHDRWLQHLADEPTDTNADDYRRLANQVRKFMPGVPLVEATMTRQLAGAIDIWCPQVQKFQANRDFFDQRIAAGDQVWIYTCLVPGGAWLNRLLDQERLRQVYFGWTAARWPISGYLHWGLNHYKADPFEQSVVDHPAQPNTTNKLPAGDTHVIYPGDPMPWSGQRFEAHRIGLEDHELLKQLQRRQPDLAQKILDQTVRAADDYQTSVAAYRQSKLQILQALVSKQFSSSSKSDSGQSARAKQPPRYGQDRVTGKPWATRSEVIAQHGMAATSQPLATQIALDVLKKGGSAVDAAIAANAALGLMEPTGCGIGGDLFAIVWDAKTQQLYGLNASGRSPQSLTLDEFQKRGLSKVPSHGPLPVSVPGCVDGWFELHDRFGKLPMDQVLAPAIDYAENGFPVTELISYYWRMSARILAKQPGFKDTFTRNGKGPAKGEVWTNPALAKTYRTLATQGRDAFYRGELADTMDAFMKRVGGFMSKEDLAAHRSEWVEPVSTTYHDWTLWELPPNGQGIAALQILNVLEGYDVRGMGFGSADYVHLFAEAKKLAFEDRARFYADMDFADVPVDKLISKAYADQRRQLIQPDRAAQSYPTTDFGKTGLNPALNHGDTIYLTTADADGNMVSLIQSNYRGMGSGLCPDGLGFGFQDRGELFDLTPGRANSYAPGKRPFHTIIPAFASHPERGKLSFGVMGGATQPQAHAQIIINLSDFGMNLQEAGDAARILHTGSSQPTGERMDDGGYLSLESWYPAAVRQDLKNRGHQIKPARGAFGGYQAILRTPTGVYFGASESRKDGHAAGY